MRLSPCLRWMVMYLATAAVVTPLAQAQSSRPLKEARSANERFVLRLTPGKPAQADAGKLRREPEAASPTPARDFENAPTPQAAPAGGDGRRDSASGGCRAILFERDDKTRQERKLWESRLVNPVAPRVAAISDDGRFVVTLDDFERGGAAHAVVVYDEHGQKRFEFGLTQLLGREDWRHVKSRGRVVRWLVKAQHGFESDPPQFVIRLGWGRTIRLGLEDGAILEGAAPLDDCESVPEDIQAALRGSADSGRPGAAGDNFAALLMGLIEDHLQEHGELSDEALRELALQAATLAGGDPEDYLRQLALDDLRRQLVEGGAAETAAQSELARAALEKAMIEAVDARAAGMSDEQAAAMEAMLRERVAELRQAEEAEASARLHAESAAQAPSAELIPPPPDPANHTDYIAWLRQQTSTSDPKAQELYKSAAELATQNVTDGVGDKLAAAMRGDAAAFADPELQAYLAQGREALAQVREATNHEYRGWPLESQDGTVIAALLPNLGGLRQTARVGIAEARRLESAGNLQEAAAIQLDLLKAGSHTGQGMTLIESLVGVAMHASVSESMLDMMARNPDKLDYAALARQMEQKFEPIRPLAQVMQGERTMMLDMLQRIYVRDPDTGETNVSAEGVAQFQALSGGDAGGFPAMLTAMSAQRTGFDESVRRTNEYYDKLTEAAAAGFPQGRSQMLEMEQQLSDPAFKAANPFLAQLTPALSRAHASTTRGEMIRRGTLVATQLQAYRQQHGSYPESLEQLGSKYAVDPLTNQPFSYRRLPDGGFALYSLGENGADDGAAHDPSGRSGDWVIWPRPPRGN